jgi:hypothetical protein
MHVVMRLFKAAVFSSGLAAPGRQRLTPPALIPLGAAGRFVAPSGYGLQVSIWAEHQPCLPIVFWGGLPGGRRGHQHGRQATDQLP